MKLQETNTLLQQQLAELKQGSITRRCMLLSLLIVCVCVVANEVQEKYEALQQQHANDNTR